MDNTNGFLEECCMGVLNSSITQMEMNSRVDTSFQSRNESEKWLIACGGVPFADPTNEGDAILSSSAVQTLQQLFLTNMLYACYNRQVGVRSLFDCSIWHQNTWRH